jgi:hypothetical protein
MRKCAARSAELKQYLALSDEHLRAVVSENDALHAYASEVSKLN